MEASNWPVYLIALTYPVFPSLGRKYVSEQYVLRNLGNGCRMDEDSRKAYVSAHRVDIIKFQFVEECIDALPLDPASVES